MPRLLNFEEITVTAPGGTVSLDVTDYIDYYRIDGDVTLTSNLTIAADGTAVYGLEYLFYYKGDIIQDGNDVTIMGQIFPENLESTRCWIRCFYNDSSTWEVYVEPDLATQPVIATDMLDNTSVTQAKLADDSVGRSQIIDSEVLTAALANDAVTGDKIASDTITADNLGGTLDSVMYTVPVSFETGEQCSNYTLCPFDGTLAVIYYSVVKDIAATDDATVNITIDGGSTSPSSFSITASTVADQTFSVPITGSGEVVAGDVIGVEGTKTTDGGKVLLTLQFTRS